MIEKENYAPGKARINKVFRTTELISFLLTSMPTKKDNSTLRNRQTAAAAC